MNVAGVTDRVPATTMPQRQQHCHHQEARVGWNPGPAPAFGPHKRAPGTHRVPDSPWQWLAPVAAGRTCLVPFAVGLAAGPEGTGG